MRACAREWQGVGRRPAKQPPSAMQTCLSGDVPVVNNYRNVLTPVLRRHGAGCDLSRVFPDFAIEPVELYG